MVFRDHEGVVVGGACLPLPNVVIPHMIEAAAGRLACEMAVASRPARVVFESDCLKMVNASKAVDIDDSGFGVIMEDIKASLLVLFDCHFTHVYRETNTLAHKFAKFGLHAGVGYQWFGDPPIALQGFLASSCTH